jgi:hypothetical protein
MNQKPNNSNSTPKLANNRNNSSANNRNNSSANNRNNSSANNRSANNRNNSSANNRSANNRNNSSANNRNNRNNNSLRNNTNTTIQNSNQSKIKKYAIIAVVIIVIIVIIFFLYKFITKKVLKIGQNEIKIDKQDYLTPFSLDYTMFTLPKNGFDYSMSFWIYVENYEYNSGLWKHIFHKGNTISETMEYKTWDELSTQATRQTPGLWMHPTTNNLRLAFNIKLDDTSVIPCGLYSQKKCGENCSICEYDDEELICKHKNSHPKNLENNFPPKCKTKPDSVDGETIEFVDIKNIPAKEMTHILFVLENKILNIYYNGILKKIHKFAGTPEFSRNDNLYFNSPQTFEGQIFNYRYIPNQINKEKITEIYKDIPFTKKFPKKFRFDNYIKRFKIIDAVKSIFI